MRWLRRGILIRLAIYVPLIAFLAWRAQGGCETRSPPKPADGLDQKLAPHRKVITLPDGTQQEIVELTAEEAEAILGPLPLRFHEDDVEAGADAKAGADASADAKAGADASADAKAGADADASADAKPQPDGGKAGD